MFIFFVLHLLLSSIYLVRSVIINSHSIFALGTALEQDENIL